MNSRNHAEVSEGVRLCTRCSGPFCPDCLVGIAGLPYCATCKTEQLLDVRSGVRPGVLDLASIGRRLGAYLLDTLILTTASAAIGAVVGVIGVLIRAGASPALACVNALMGLTISLSYDAILVAAKGQTLGKMALKVKVVSETGAGVTAGQAWDRAFAKLIPFSQLVALFNDERKGIHDMLAHTRVVNWT